MHVFTYFCVHGIHMYICIVSSSMPYSLKMIPLIEPRTWPLFNYSGGQQALVGFPCLYHHPPPALRFRCPLPWHLTCGAEDLNSTPCDHLPSLSINLFKFNPGFPGGGNPWPVRGT